MRSWLRIDTRARAITFLLACALAALATLLASGSSLLRLYGWLPDGALNSDRLRVMHDIARTWEQTPPDVLLLGGSQLRELMPDDPFISAALAADCGRPIRVFNAATSAQPLESSWAVADLLRRPGQLVVINLNISRVIESGTTKFFPRALLPLESAASMPAGIEQVPLSEFARRRNQLGILFTDAITALGLHGGRFENLGPFTSSQHLYRGTPRSRELKLIDAGFEAEHLRPLAAEGIGRNAAAFAVLARHRQADHTRVAFLLAPTSPEMRESLEEFSDPVNRATATLHAVAPLLDLRQSDALSPEDFADSLHLTARGRQLMWPALRAFLRSQLPDCAGSKR